MRQRRLTAILSADVAGYSGLMEADEAGTLARLKAALSGVFEPQVAAHQGRVFKLMGDGALAEFASAEAAVRCALEVQEKLKRDGALSMRIGVNLGDVIVEGDDLFGNGVNVAARLQALAAPGGIALSRTVHEQVAGKVSARFEDAGEHRVKNLEQPLRVFAWGEVAAASQRVSICVLPFVNMSGDPDQDYFSDGVSEDIITDLSRVSALAVVSRNTAFTFKGKAVDVRQLARQLKVSHVLEGSVRKAGNRVRITAQLIDGQSDEHVWAERWDRNLEDIFALQDEISQAVVAALKLKLLPDEKKAIERRGTANTEAYEIYLKARNYYFTGTMTDAANAEKVVRLCRLALELDPDYAQAWAMLATAQRALAYVGAGDEDGMAAADRALALDPTLGEAHGARIGALMSARQYERARQAIEIALAIEPDSYDVNKEAGRLVLREQRYADAVGFYEKATSVMEADFASPGMLMTCYNALGDRAGVKRSAEVTLARVGAFLKREPDHGSALSLGVGALAALGQAARAKEWTARALQVDPANLNMRYNIACTFISDLKQYEAALDLLEPVLAQFGKDRLAHVRTDPDLDAVRRQHPRFVAMMAAAEARLESER